jgi:3-hydroxy-9,10-secoandrosta-1,3,5(10)-triene-9,17-dione monooxygenase
VPVPAPPELSVDPEVLVARAAALRASLRADAEAAAERGSASVEHHEAFLEAGFYRLLQPRRFGGLQGSLRTFLRVIAEVGRGDPGAAWGLCLASGHALHLGSFYEEEAQAELFGDGDFRCAQRAVPHGRAERVPGGWRVRGSWDYASGITYATHFMGTVFTDDGGQIVVTVPRAQVTVVDDWGGGRTLGLNATGSNTVVLDDVVVPERWAVPYDWKGYVVPEDGSPGFRAHGDPLYLGRILTVFMAELTAPMVGAGFAALDEYEDIARTKQTSFPPRMPRTESPFVQAWLGEAMGCADGAEALLLAAADRWADKGRRWAQDGEPFTAADDLRLREVVQQAAQLAWRGVELMFRTGGSSSAVRGSRLQALYRDVSMYRTHIGAQYAATATSAARAHLGLDVDGI